MSLHDYDFNCNTAQLNLRGKDRLLWIAGQMGHVHCPIVIERTPDAPGLAEMRRTTILNELTALLSVPVPPEMVVVGPPRAIPLNGVEAEILYFNLLQQTRGAGAATAGQSLGGGINLSGSTGTTGTTSSTSTGR